MKTATLLFLVAGVFLICRDGTDARSSRRKRNVLELAEVISCVTGYTPIEVWLKVDGYGCYCGLGGQGRPLDEADECCRQHDSCYDEAQSNGNCPGNMAYTTTYHYDKQYCKTADSSITCNPASSYKRAEVGNCAAELCECDTALGECLRGKKINPQYKKYNKDSCRAEPEDTSKP